MSRKIMVTIWLGDLLWMQRERVEMLDAADKAAEDLRLLRKSNGILVAEKERAQKTIDDLRNDILVSIRAQDDMERKLREQISELEQELEEADCDCRQQKTQTKRGKQ
jgi:hypothetical protein